MKKIFFPLFFVIILFFSAVGLAHGDGNGSTTESSTSPSGGTITGGGPAGKAWFQEITNPNGGPHRGVSKELNDKISEIKNRFLKANRNNKISRIEKNGLIDDLTRNVERYLCSGGSNLCPGWRTVTNGAGSLSNQIYYKLHPLKRGLWQRLSPPSENIPIAFNIRIWRQNPVNEKFQLIFRRSLAAPNKEQRKDLIDKKVKNKKFFTPRQNSDFVPRNFLTTATVWPGSVYENGKTSNDNWWNGFAYPYWEKSERLGGPFSHPDPSKIGSNCQDNIYKPSGAVNGERFYQGRRVTPSEFNPFKARKRGKLQRGGSWCYWEGKDFGAGAWRNGKEFGPNLKSNGKGLKESLFVKWDFNNYRPKGGRANFGYDFEGVPGELYIVHMAIVDSRQNMMKMKGSNFNNQIIKAFYAKAPVPIIEETCKENPSINDPVKCPPPPDPCVLTPSSCKIDVRAPVIQTEVLAETPLQVRQQSQQSVAITTANDLLNEQSVLPYSISMHHYTPQLNYSVIKTDESDIPTGSGLTYPEEFVNYSPDFISSQMGLGSAGGSDMENAYLPKGEVLNVTGVGSNFLLKQSIQKSPANLNLIPVAELDADYDQLVSGDLVSEKSYDITWNQPTLENPCAYEGSLIANSYRLFDTLGEVPDWPEDLSKCKVPEQDQVPGPDEPVLFQAYDSQSGVPWRNVWDDVLSVGSNSELQSVIRSKNPGKKEVYSRGHVKGPGNKKSHTLRCSDKNFEPESEILNKSLLNATSAPGWTYGSKLCDRSLIPVFPSQATQKAQATAFIAGAKDNKNRAYLNFKTNIHNATVLGLKIYPRGSDPDDPDNVVKLESDIDLTKEINLCRQGAPPNTKYINNDGEIKSSAGKIIGDPNCRGFVFKWNWRTNIGCKSKKPTPDLISKSNNLMSFSQSYSGDSDPENKIKNGTGPFKGPWPATKSAINSSERCSGGKYPTKGYWKLDVAEESGWGAGNDGPRVALQDLFDFGATDGVLVIEFDIGSPLSNTIDPKCTSVNSQSCWSIFANYSGYPQLIWASDWKSSPAWEPLNGFQNTAKPCGNNIQENCSREFSPPLNIAYIKVFGSENSR